MTATSSDQSCSAQSLARDDALYGTASAGSDWLFLELPGAWGESAFFQSPSTIDPQLGRAIVRRAEERGMRIAAIRRHGRRSATPRWRWFIARSTVGSELLHHGEVDDPAEYATLDLDGSSGTLANDPLVVVCAHGKHDRCCAVRGRAAAAAIASRHPEYTWECSHLGGDRFAATMLILPEGLCYGRVDTTDGARLVDLYRNGRRLDNQYLRGRTSLPQAVQAAQYFARREYGDDRIDTLTPLRTDTVDGLHRMTLRARSGHIEVSVAEDTSVPLQSKCNTQALPVRVFSLTSIAAMP